MADGILLVEDNATDVQFFRLALDKGGLGSQLQVVRDGQEAIDYLSGERAFSDRSAYPIPRLVLLDLRLPLVSGLEVLQWIRSQPQFSSMIVVVLTGSNHPGDMTQAYQLGANSVLNKPSNSADMPQLIKSVLGYWRT